MSKLSCGAHFLCGRFHERLLMKKKLQCGILAPMVIVLKKNSTEGEEKELRAFLEKKNFKLNTVSGEENTIIAAVGKSSIDKAEVEHIACVEKVIPISKPYKMASRQFKKEDTIVEVVNSRGQKIRIGGQHIVTIAGPGAVESREQIMQIAEQVAASGAVMLRGGTFMPRSSPYSFQGLGEEGLSYLREAGDRFGLLVVSEVTAEHLIPIMADKVDVFQIGSRNMQNFDLLKKVGATGKPVILKRSYTATYEEFLMSAEYLLASGTDNVILCERGIRTFEHTTRNTLDLASVPVLKSMTHLPVIVDPSHAVGIRDKVPSMGLASIAAGADGVAVEVHTDPVNALSGGAFSMVPEQFDKLMRDIESLAPVMGKSVAHVMMVPHVERKKASRTSDSIIVSYCGKPGCNAEAALKGYFDTTAESLPLDSFEEVFQSVIDGKADYGMIPIENSLGGSVYQNYDNFKRFQDVMISGAIAIKISYCLLGVKGARIEDIRKVYSHPQALLQTSRYLKGHKDWQQLEAYNTSGAALFVSENGSRENAAVASAINAQIYGLEILAQGIEDDASNFTRFVVISADNVESKVSRESNRTPNMASFMFKAKNEPGSLYSILGVLKDFDTNLTRLESRPMPGRPWEYLFYADADLKSITGDPDEYVRKFVGKLQEKADEVRLLGVYSEVGRY